MKIVKIMGGLGNQMSQYAFARAIEEKFGEEVLLDLSWYEEIKDLKKHPNTTQRNYELDLLNISLKIATPKQVTECINEKKSKMPPFLCKMLKKPRYTNNIILQGDTTEFVPELLEYKENAYYIGYFQSEKYFIDIREILLKEFSPKAKMNEQNQEILKQIRANNSVSLHVRRGDYVNSPTMSAIYQTCSPDYYKEAADYIASKSANPHFYLFSDDIPWVKENIKIDYPLTIVNLNGEENAYFDMELMKNCKHNIVANSTFSFWGSWLNQNPNKIAIAPQKLFNETAYKNGDLLPDNWIKL